MMISIFSGSGVAHHLGEAWLTVPFNCLIGRQVINPAIYIYFVKEKVHVKWLTQQIFVTANMTVLTGQVCT